MSYIWNRAERVPEAVMPQRLDECFQEWSKEQYNHLKYVTSRKRSKAILKTIAKQRKNYEDAVERFHLKTRAV